VKIGMHASEVRDTLERYLKAKGDKQDFLVLSDNETAQIFYDGTGKVTAISIDYTAKNGNAPTPMDVLGADIEPKPDGSMYALKRYPAAGYWVSYNRTSGESPTVTITMQALR
jgi:ribosomal protein S18 acetylase RimI-like enzyme